ncbi:MAG: hypothetical protein RLZZ502_1659 [Pseudomonadota bacterium]
MRLVLDTNILLSLFVFHDPRHIALRNGWQRGHYQLLLRQDCFEEFIEVIARRQFKQSAEQVRLSADALRGECTWVDQAKVEHPISLPKCRDKDDQKFLELAAGGQAEALLTYDKLLLKCRKRVRFQIVTPEIFFEQTQHIKS